MTKTTHPECSTHQTAIDDVLAALRDAREEGETDATVAGRLLAEVDAGEWHGSAEYLECVRYELRGIALPRPAGPCNT